MTIDLNEKINPLETSRFSPDSSTFLKDPYPFYSELRSTNPIYWVNSFRYPGWYITGYEETMEILRDTRFENRIPLPQESKKYAHLKDLQNGMMLFKNKTDHKRLRFIISKEFSVRKMENYRPLITETVNELLDQVENKQKMDIVSDYAFPLASLIIAKIIGVPKEERYQFRKWAKTLIQTTDLARSRRTLLTGNYTTVEMIDYFKELIKKRKLKPKDDLISRLLTNEDDEITDDEILSTCVLLVVAGHETTVNLISNAVLALLNQPDQLIKLKQDPSLIKMAVAEFLRYESPTQMTARIASEDIEINQTTISKGEQVYLFLGAANRDPKQFKDAHLLDITRKSNPHLAFGHGSHFCIGALLAQIEAEVAINTLLHRLPNLKLATSNVNWRELVGFRTLKELPISFD